MITLRLLLRAPSLVLAACFCFCCALTPLSAQTIGSTLSATASVQDTYYVSPTGNNATALKNDPARPYRTVFRAFYTAHHQSIRVGRSAKVYIRNGEYRMDGTVSDEKALWPDADWGTGAQALFIIEGESRDGVVIRTPGSAFLRFTGKSNVIIRNFTLRGTRNLQSTAGEWGLISLFYNDVVGDTTNALVEDITVLDADWIGMFIFRVDNTTVRRCRLNNGIIYPIKVYTRLSKYEDLNLNNNGIDGQSEYGNGGFMFIGQDCEVTRVESSGDRGGYGFRMDHVARRVTLRDCVFNNNAAGGIIFETAEGPVNIINCTANNNGDEGLRIAVAHDLTVDGCTFENNGVAAILVHPMQRDFDGCPTFCRAGDLDAPEWLNQRNMNWNVRTTVRNTRMVASGSQVFYRVPFEVTGNWAGQYGPWVQNEFTGSNNTYIHATNATSAFELRKDNAVDVWGDFIAWKNTSGSDGNSTFTLGSAPPPPPPVTGFNAKINFGNNASGWLNDSGDTYAARNGQTYGWNIAQQSRVRGVNADPLLDSLVQLAAGARWEIAVPNGVYSVRLSVGDPSYASTGQTVNLEGTSVWAATPTAANQFLNVTRTVSVADGKLTLDNGAAATNLTKVNYLEITEQLEQWLNRDIGSTSPAGSAALSGTGFTVRGSGADIWGSSDSFHYVYQTLIGDGSIVARVSSQQNTDPWAKAGVMSRETTDPQSKHVSLYVTPSNGLALQSRTSYGGTTANTSLGGIAAPVWLRVTRVGNVFTAARSPDGSTWTQVGSPVTMGLQTNLLLGLAVTSHNNGTLNEVQFTNVTATP